MNIKIYFSGLFIAIAINMYSQPGNYWSMGSNTESSILAGAVVGGGSGITSAFYNPANISELKSNKISIDASLFNFNFISYENAFGKNRDINYLDFEVQPRFFSFIYLPKKYPKLSFQYTVFNRGKKLIKLYDSGKSKVIEPVTGIQKEYSVNFNYENRYNDTWLGFGTSYTINNNWAIGFSALGSAKTFMYFENSSVDLIPIGDTAIGNSKFIYYDRQDLYVASLIGKFGIQYKTNRWTYGVNFTTPSWRLFGDGYHRREVSMSNVIYNGVKMADYVRKETNYHIVSNFKEPLSIAFGLTYLTKNKTAKFYFSTEYFAPIDDYKSIDNSRVSDFFSDKYSPGSYFLTYQYGAHSVLNVAVGFKRRLTDYFSYMLGFKTDFAAYRVSETQSENLLGHYNNGVSNLYHLTSGTEFRIMKVDVLFGLEYTFGMRKNMYQFSNFDYPGIYDTYHNLALQSYPEPTMNYMINGIGIYLGLALNFD